MPAGRGAVRPARRHGARQADDGRRDAAGVLRVRLSPVWTRRRRARRQADRSPASAAGQPLGRHGDADGDDSGDDGDGRRRPDSAEPDAVRLRKVLGDSVCAAQYGGLRKGNYFTRSVIDSDSHRMCKKYFANAYRILTGERTDNQS